MSGGKHKIDLKNYIKNFARLKPGNIAVFPQKGDLCCKDIIHAAYSACDGTHNSITRARKSLRQVIRKILSYVVDNDIASIAIPALGTESKDFEPAVFGEIFFAELKNFIIESKGEMAQRRIILFSEDTSIRSAIKSQVEKIMVERAREAEPSDEEDTQPSERKITKEHRHQLQQSLESDQEKRLVEAKTENANLKDELKETKKSLKSAKAAIDEKEGLLEAWQEKYQKKKDSMKELKQQKNEEEKESMTCDNCGEAIEYFKHQKDGRHQDKCYGCYIDSKWKKKYKKKMLEMTMEEEDAGEENISTTKSKRTKRRNE